MKSNLSRVCDLVGYSNDAAARMYRVATTSHAPDALRKAAETPLAQFRVEITEDGDVILHYTKWRGTWNLGDTLDVYDAASPFRYVATVEVLWVRPVRPRSRSGRIGVRVVSRVAAPATSDTPPVPPD